MKNNSTNPGDDLQAIRDIMERSSRFLSLSGLSGIFAGACALAGAAIAWLFILDSGNIRYDEYWHSAGVTPSFSMRNYLILDALLVLAAALLGAAYFSRRKAMKAGTNLWTVSTKRLILHLTIPLFTGGIFILILAYRGNIELVVPAMLIFYGLALVNAGKFTFGEIHYLGLTQIGLGILAAIFTGYGLIFWTAGFGLMHIIYGGVMYLRYERVEDIET